MCALGGSACSIIGPNGTGAGPNRGPRCVHSTEFLAPIAEIESYLDGVYSDEAIKDACAHRVVSLRAAQSCLSNSGRIARF